MPRGAGGNPSLDTEAARRAEITTTVLCKLLVARRMSRRILIVLVVAGILSGCLEEKPANSNTGEPTPTITIDANRPEPTFGEIPPEEAGQVAAPDVNATLAAAPKWVEGEWWRIRFHDSFSGTDVEFVRVVAKVEDEGYVVGMPHEAWYKEAVVYHTPAFGDVNLDLSYHAHDVPFLPLKFPLTNETTWTTHWESETPDLQARVTVESPTRAKVSFVGPDCGPLGFFGVCPNPQNEETEVVSLVYNAQIHEVESLTIGNNFFSYEVVEHGYGFKGWITVPRGEDLVFFHGRLGASTMSIGGAPAMPTETVKVEGGFNRISFILVVGNVVGAPAGGTYSIKAVAPDGTEYKKESQTGGPFNFEFYEGMDPDGDWTFDYTVVGPGIAFIEGIAYHQYDIHLPDGQIRSDHSHAVVR